MTDFIVYMATNTANGKRYVGATKLGIEARRERHFKDVNRKGRDCPRFYDAIRKYGEDAFDWTTLAALPTAEEMYKEEERLIALLKPEYNIASGGLIFTSKEKQAQFAKAGAERSRKPVICLNDGSIYESGAAAGRALGVNARWVPQMCRHGHISRGGLAFAFLDGPMSEHERNELLLALTSKKSAAEEARVKKCSLVNSRPVTCLNTGAIYTSAGAADKSLKLVHGTVESCCRRGRANRRGDCFAFGELSEAERLVLWKVATAKRQAIDAGWKEKLSKKRSRVVICEDTRQLYDNPRAAAKDHGLSPYIIYASCWSGNATRTGVSFSYLDEWCPNPE